ncbi:MAG TPA: hypothetical protein VMV92_09810 [Streptosporangiaceae bacterium]|nr:hypothetical protein [Streptosporangiaceae bacterium]
MTSTTPGTRKRNTPDRIHGERGHRRSASRNRTRTHPHTASAGRRHTFAISNLRSWFDHGEDANALLPVLQACMGHSSIGDTACYLRLTAESCPQIAARLRQPVGDIVPPVTGGTGHGD